MNDSNILLILKDVERIYQTKVEVDQLTGRSFNLIKLLRKIDDEVYLHSALIAELLSTKGSHYEKRFFQLFISELKDNVIRQDSPKDTQIIDFLNKIPSDDWEIFKEKWIENGRVDILCRSLRNNYGIIIENKLGGIDQKKQIERYYLYGKKRFDENKFLIIYLSLKGGNPSSESLGEVSKDQILCISYVVIKNWISKCAEICYSKPILRESLVQYHDILKKLTGDDMETHNKEEIINALISGKNLLYAEQIRNYFEDARLVRIKMIENQILNMSLFSKPIHYAGQIFTRIYDLENYSYHYKSPNDHAIRVYYDEKENEIWIDIYIDTAIYNKPKIDKLRGLYSKIRCDADARAFWGNDDSSTVGPGFCAGIKVTASTDYIVAFDNKICEGLVNSFNDFLKENEQVFTEIFNDSSNWANEYLSDQKSLQ